jgi:hypothetical protein
MKLPLNLRIEPGVSSVEAAIVQVTTKSDLSQYISVFQLDGGNSWRIWTRKLDAWIDLSVVLKPARRG